MFRTVYVSQGQQLNIKNNWLIIKDDSKNSAIPLDDIQALIIDNLQTMISSYTLCMLAKNGINTILCNDKHLPVCNILSLNNHYKSSSVLKDQISLSKNIKDILWQNIIDAKISNQIKVLQLNNVDDFILSKLKQLKLTLLPGDTTNREAVCSRIFFYQLYGKNFKRFNYDNLNIALNYGYSIIRTAIARSLTVHGYNCALGIHHKNQFNSFNLADDFIEPFRPLVDLYIHKNQKIFLEKLTKKHRLLLINLLNHTVLLKNKQFKLYIAIDKYINSFTAYINSQNIDNFLLPKIDYEK